MVVGNKRMRSTIVVCCHCWGTTNPQTVAAPGIRKITNDIAMRRIWVCHPVLPCCGATCHEILEIMPSNNKNKKAAVPQEIVSRLQQQEGKTCRNNIYCTAVPQQTTKMAIFLIQQNHLYTHCKKSKCVYSVKSI